MPQTQDWQLPGYAHLPGINVRPGDGVLEQIAGMAPKPTVAATARTNAVWLYGLKLIEAGFYWEAHEVLEPVWWNAAPNGRERHCVQGVIQLANAALKAKCGRLRAAVRLARIAAGLLERARRPDEAIFMGVDLGEAMRIAACLAEGDEPPSFSALRLQSNI
ncbi:MAG: hypothetical protein Pars93KO_28180 [Parasphingorhabdus sp.]